MRKATPGAEEVIVRVDRPRAGPLAGDLERIFEPFERATAEARGTGSALRSRRASPRRTGARLASSRGAGRARRSRSRSRSRPRRTDGGDERPRILVVDDEPQILRALKTNLRGAGYEVETAATRQGALAPAAIRPPEAIILDLVLPDGKGIDVCRELRRWTKAPDDRALCRRRGAEKIAALDAGADDYVTKPFSIEELLARLRAALRRAGPASEPGDRDRRDRDRPGEARGRRSPAARFSSPAHEFELLRVLAQNPGKLMTHRVLLREVWGPAYGTESHYLHVYVSQLRRKIEADPARPRYLLTEPEPATGSSTRTNEF